MGIIRRIRVGVLNGKTCKLQKAFEQASKKEKDALREKMSKLQRKYNKVYKLKVIRKNNNKYYDFLKKNAK